MFEVPVSHTPEKARAEIAFNGNTVGVWKLVEIENVSIHHIFYLKKVKDNQYCFTFFSVISIKPRWIR